MAADAPGNPDGSGPPFRGREPSGGPRPGAGVQLLRALEAAGDGSYQVFYDVISEPVVNATQGALYPLGDIGQGRASLGDTRSGLREVVAAGTGNLPTRKLAPCAARVDAAFS